MRFGRGASTGDLRAAAASELRRLGEPAPEYATAELLPTGGVQCEERPVMTAELDLLALIQKLHRAIREEVVRACLQQPTDELCSVAQDDEGDTIYSIDKVGEALLLEHLEPAAADVGGIVLVVEGIPGGELSLPRGRPAEELAWRLIVDPIDGTRGIMYQKRSAWVLSALAPNRGPDTALADVVVSVQTEIPTVKQHLCDELWAVRGLGVRAERLDRLSGERTPLVLRASRAPSIEHGYAMVSRFFPGARDELAAIDEAVVQEVLGASPTGKALCFEDQYASTAGQLYELMCGHDRFNADLRPLMRPVLERRRAPLGLCCHPYDICTVGIATKLGVIVTDPQGRPLDAPLTVDADVAWIGYANEQLRQQIEPVLRAVLAERGLLPE